MLVWRFDLGKIDRERVEALKVNKLGYNKITSFFFQNKNTIVKLNFVTKCTDILKMKKIIMKMIIPMLPSEREHTAEKLATIWFRTHTMRLQEASRLAISLLEKQAEEQLRIITISTSIMRIIMLITFTAMDTWQMNWMMLKWIYLRSNLQMNDNRMKIWADTSCIKVKLV